MYDGKIFKAFLLRSGITIYWKSYLIQQGKRDMRVRKEKRKLILFTHNMIV